MSIRGVSNPMVKMGSRILRRCFSTSRSMAQRRLESFEMRQLTSLGTRSIFSETHDLFREQARRFFREQVEPYHMQWEKDGKVSREVWKQAGELGLLCAQCPEENGGLGADALYSACVWEEQAISGCFGPGFAIHSDIVAPYIWEYGSAAQKE